MGKLVTESPSIHICRKGIEIRKDFAPERPFDHPIPNLHQVQLLRSSILENKPGRVLPLFTHTNELSLIILDALMHLILRYQGDSASNPHWFTVPRLEDIHSAFPRHTIIEFWVLEEEVL
jgi:hypothetical protein